MANPWFRLWSDMINDPKWRTIARSSGQKIGDVIATYIHMLTAASNATERGRTEGWNDEDVATALDIETSQVEAIRKAMQGRVLDGDYLLGWEKRQPIKEDGAAERARAWREAKKATKEQEETQPNATERNRTTDEMRLDKSKPTTSNEVVVGNDVANSCPHQEIIAIYHETLAVGTRIRVWNGTRMKHLQARWREDAKRQRLDWWKRFFEYVAESEFLTGRAPTAHGRDPFVVSLDWLVNPQNFAKVIEGRYNREMA